MLSRMWGARIRPGLERGRSVCALPARQDRRRPHQDGAPWASAWGRRSGSV